MRLGSTGDPFRWYISHPAKWGPLTSHFSRLPSDVSMNAPLRVPTRTRTPLMIHPCPQHSSRFSEELQRDDSCVNGRRDEALPGRVRTSATHYGCTIWMALGRTTSF